MDGSAVAAIAATASQRARHGRLADDVVLIWFSVTWPGKALSSGDAE